ncbi:MAG: XdhC family protein [bacterium]|nr:XdhC family protein [bacterium]
MELHLYRKLTKMLKNGEPAALVTVVSAKGSTPRGAGTKMLVNKDGITIGTIGGGCPEAEACKEALASIREKKSALLIFNMNNKGDAEMICGGRQDILTEYLTESSAGIFEELVRTMEENAEPITLFTVLNPSVPNAETAACPRIPFASRLVLAKEFASAPEWLDEPLKEQLREIALKAANRPDVFKATTNGVEYDIFAEVSNPVRRLYIAGGGHVSRPLCKVAALCGYAVTVIDDREDFASREYFPDAEEVVCAPFIEYFSKIKGSRNTSVVLVTRGHKHDEDCLYAISGREFGYVGMIGSRHRNTIVMDIMKSRGVSPEWLKNVYAPIGLDLGGETPEEIAVAIVAEMIAVRCNSTRALAAKLSIN